MLNVKPHSPPSPMQSDCSVCDEFGQSLGDSDIYEAHIRAYALGAGVWELSGRKK